MKSIIVIGIVIAGIIGGIIGGIAVLASVPSDTWTDKRTEFTGVAPPDENDDRIDCLSRGGIWDVTSCSIAPDQIPGLDCLGSAQCFVGVVTKIVDGDTILVDDQSVRFSLASAPPATAYGGADAKNFIETLCPVGSKVTVDEDDGQVLGVYGRLVGVVYCGDVILNQEILDSSLGYLEDRFCDSSEFASTTWAIKHGCES